MPLSRKDAEKLRDAIEAKKLTKEFNNVVGARIVGKDDAFTVHVGKLYGVDPQVSKDIDKLAEAITGRKPTRNDWRFEPAGGCGEIS